MTLFQFVQANLPHNFIDSEKSDWNIIWIKPEYQVEANTKYLRSQAFTSKLTPEQKLEYPFAPKELQCKIQYFTVDNNNCIWAVDEHNKISPKIHVDNLNNYDNNEK